MSCECTSTVLSCCPDKTFVQDKVCSPWSGTVVAADVTVILYTNNINQTVVGTGFIKYDVGPTDITVQVLDSTATIIDTQTLSPGSSLGFTYRQFNTIQVILPLATPGVYQGEFCITSRYPVS
ncbi:hypothetical protein BAMA_24145 [Bacillus manliponensis]|uniref:Endospore appendages core domain-containing protein n=1 Tax=Bacillus manliponensis TaxID=574376 RepID=A0A073JXT7_9BACI|nr:S-Ena type endospore appendage [Bacillus manliponensis]KEK19106.1 hypothetical protein BAMA_24145 [Bacillus manliponensis]